MKKALRLCGKIKKENSRKDAKTQRDKKRKFCAFAGK